MTYNQAWWNRHPQVLLDEEQALRNLADDGEIVADEEALHLAQIRRYTLVHTSDGTTIDLEVTFADHHPYFRPYVEAAQLIGVHQDPYSKELCLLEGDTWHWDLEQTVGEMIALQLPKLLADRSTPESESVSGQPDTAHVEPYVGYFACAAGTAVRVGDTTDAMAGVDSGTMTIALDPGSTPDRLRGTVIEIDDQHGATNWTAPAEVRERYGQLATPRLIAPWVRLQQPPTANDAETVLRAVREAWMGPWPKATPVGGGVDLIVAAVVFEDGIRPFERGDAWLFPVNGWLPAPRQTGRVRPPRPTIAAYLARAFRADRTAMTERTPTLAPLAEKRVVLIGTGGVGGPIAIELAKAGIGTLVLLDKDYVDPGNAARWSLGYFAAGHSKVLALADLIGWQWPHTTVITAPGALGQPRNLGEREPQWHVLDTLLLDADLVIDSTAEIGVTYFLSDVTREHVVPLVIASTTEGGWGGRIIHLGTAIDAPCWFCIEAYTLDGTLPTPPHDPKPDTGLVHPAGCTTPTFTATGFDVASISLAATRLAASLLCTGSDNGYPPADWNVAIYSFRDATTAGPGEASRHDVHQHPKCSSCKQRQSG